MVEVMVAMFVLTTGFLAILSLLAQSLYLSKNESNQTNATYLASEGIELARNLVDHDVYQHLAGLGSGWGTTFGTGGDFELDYTTCTNLPNAASACDPQPFSSQDFLYYDPTSHTYRYSFDNPLGDSLVKTPFTRLIRVTPNGANEITVQSIVTWDVGSVTGQQSVDLEDHFYNWYPSS